MYLYHYSDILFDQLKTRKAQGIKRPKKELDEMIAWKLATDDVGIYDEHISLFFDSIPRDLPQIFELRHPFGCLEKPSMNTW